MVPDDDEKASQVDLVDEDSCMVFHILNMDGGWLSATPKQWHESAEYRELCSFVASLKVTIDTAERGVGSPAPPANQTHYQRHRRMTDTFKY